MSHVRRAAIPAVLLVLAIARLLFGDPFAGTDAAEEPGVSEEASEVLDGLDVGDEIAGFEVTTISGPAEREIVIELERDGAGLRAWVTRHGGRAYDAPVVAGEFDLFYGSPSPGVVAAANETSIEALTTLGERIEAGGATVPPNM